MRKLAFFVVVAFLFAQCADPPAADQSHLYDIEHTSDPSELYFKNVRRSKYYLLPSKDQRIQEYKHKKWVITKERPQIIPHILINKHRDKAHLMLNTNSYPTLHEPMILRVISLQDTTLYTHQYPVKKQMALAVKLDQALQLQSRLSIMQRDSTFVDVLNNSEDRSPFGTTMRDYLRLIEFDRKLEKESLFDSL